MERAPNVIKFKIVSFWLSNDYNNSDLIDAILQTGSQDIIVHIIVSKIWQDNEVIGKAIALTHQFKDEKLSTLLTHQLLCELNNPPVMQRLLNCRLSVEENPEMAANFCKFTSVLLSNINHSDHFTNICNATCDMLVKMKNNPNCFKNFISQPHTIRKLIEKATKESDESSLRLLKILTLIQANIYL